jgi:hypothetical protein
MIITRKRKILKYNGVEYKAYDKEYNDKALDNDKYMIKRIMKLI